MKVMMVFEMYATKRKVKTLLGEATFLKIFAEAKRQEERLPAVPEVNRVLNGEVVGKQLPKSGKGVRAIAAFVDGRDVDPQQCPHPAPSMKREGNKHMKS